MERMKIHDYDLLQAYNSIWEEKETMRREMFSSSKKTHKVLFTMAPSKATYARHVDVFDKAPLGADWTIVVLSIDLPC